MKKKKENKNKQTKKKNWNLLTVTDKTKLMYRFYLTF